MKVDDDRGMRVEMGQEEVRIGGAEGVLELGGTPAYQLEGAMSQTRYRLQTYLSVFLLRLSTPLNPANPISTSTRASLSLPPLCPDCRPSAGPVTVQSTFVLPSSR